MPQPNKTRATCHPPARPEDLFEYFQFHRAGKVLEDAPGCGLTLKAAGSMRFRWNENNPNRDKVFSNLLSSLYTAEPSPYTTLSSSGLIRGSVSKIVVPVQLDHTHIVYDIKSPEDTKNKIGDGIITTNRSLIPTVTVADCMPLYLYDPVTGVFGIVHSGWKGTGIVVDAIELAKKDYGARAEDFCIILGPHIRDCCYIVNEERANWFAESFTPKCVRLLEPGVKVDWNNGGGPLYRLSLEKANLAALQKAGVLKENIWVHSSCTCCFKSDAEYKYGSNRRETKLNGAPDRFTVQAAFIKW